MFLKKFLIIFMFLFCFSLSACNSNNSIDQPDVDMKNKKTSIYLTIGFEEIINNNPIDMEFGEIKFTGSMIDFIEKTIQYRNLWQSEIENSYNHLLTVLNTVDKESLKESQDGWTKYMNYNDVLQKSFFYERNYNDDSGHDQIMFVVDYQAELTKRRALELMEYLFRITGEVEFIYKN